MSAVLPSASQWNAWSGLRWLLAGVLVVAALIKAWTSAEILSAEGILSHSWVLFPAIFVEVACAVWIAVAPEIISWRIAAGLFALLACAAAYAWMTGQDCQCFGGTLGAKVTLPMDLGALLLLGIFRPRASRFADQSETETSDAQPSKAHTSGPPKLRLWSLSLGLAGLCVLLAVSRHSMANRSDPIEFLLADTVLDQPWPLDASFHPDLAELASGRWLVLVVRRDCDHCRELLGEFFGDPARHRDQERTAVLVAGEDSWPFALDEVKVDLAESNRSINWPETEPFVASPAVFVLEDGMVLQAADGSDSHDLLVSLFSPSQP